tara:strand:+ start:2623 stop:3090 length:468 start_codon:yes stop_codon:yes gene_type:complete
MILAIDPGMRGALAMLYEDGGLFVEDMPIIGKEVNARAIADLLIEFPPDHAWIEKVNAFGMGRQSAFNFGQGVGACKGVIASLAIPYTEVVPPVWKKHFRLNRDKDAARAAATRLFPDHGRLFTRKKDDGRAEAALIALYARQIGGMSNAQTKFT